MKTSSFIRDWLTFRKSKKNTNVSSVKSNAFEYKEYDDDDDNDNEGIVDSYLEY